MKKLIFLFFAFILFATTNINAQTTLVAGDIAFIGINSDGSDDFSFLLLKNIENGTILKITDQGWDDATSSFYPTAGDETLTWTADSDMTAGSIIHITTAMSDGSTLDPDVASVGSLSGNTTIGSFGDQVFIYQGSASSPTFITGIHFNIEAGITTEANWDGAVGSTGKTCLPDQLTNGVNAIWVYAPGPTEQDNFIYNCTTTSGDASTLNAAINNVNNWSKDDATPYTLNPFPCSFIVIAGNNKPTASSFTASPIYQNTAYAFSTANFGYSDSDGDPLDHIRITAVPGTGTLWIDADADGIIDGTENTITNGETITKVELDAGKFKYINTSGSSSSFTFDVNDGTDYSASTYTATLTVTPEPTVTLSLDPSSSISENGGTTNVKATLSHTFNKTVTVNLVFTGTASGSDYSVTASSISITSGNTNNSVTITGQNDALDENNETVIVDISSVTNGSESGTQQVTCTLTDDDAAPTVSFTSASQSSADESGTFTITAQLSAISGKDITVPFTVDALSTAVGSGTDYSITTSPVYITAGNSTADITITIANDAIDENDETIIVNMGTPVNATQGATTTHTATITDDDAAPIVTFTSVSQSSADESGTLTITAQLSAISGKDITVPFTVDALSTAVGSGTDYSITASPVNITAGNSTIDITITIANDAIDEYDETIIVNMDSPVNATQGATTTHTATITDDDAVPTIAFTSGSQSSADEIGIFTLTAQLSAISGKDVTVPFTVDALSTAVGSGTDYSIVTSPVYITAGNSSVDIIITIATDILDEYNETIIVNMGTPVNAIQGATTTHTATITDNDASPTVAFTSASQSSADESGTLTITAQLSAISGKDITVPFTIDALSTAVGSGTDYSITASPVYITAGNLSTNITITIANDVIDENDETIIVNMGSPVDATQGIITSHTVTITDDDSSPAISFNSTNSSGLESISSKDLQVDLSAISGLDVTVDYTVSGTATGSGTDYTLANGTLTINAGDVNNNITIAGIVNDVIDEDNETVIVTLSNPVNASLGTNTIYTYTIIDDDDLPTVTTQEVTNLNATSVTANGTITDLGVPDPSVHGFCYNKTGSPSLSDSHVDMGPASSTGTFSTTINFLDPITTYYIRSYATNTAGTSYGEVKSFTTLPLASEVTTQAVTGITTNTAIGNGNITVLGVPNPTAYGVCWNTEGNPTISDSYTDEGAATVTGPFASDIASLSPNTFYCVRAYATNDAGTSYGTQVFFTTLAEAPMVTTNPVTELSTTSATLSGTVNAKNSSTTVSFEYGTSDSYGTIVTAESLVGGDSDITVSYEITGLSINTTYHYRVVGVNDGGTSYGADMTFTTTPEAAVVTSQAVSGITQTTATGNGNIIDLGNPNPTAHGVCWNTEGNPTIADSYTDEGAALLTGAFTSEIASLNANTVYYVKAYATSSVGTVYGEEVSFKTLPDPPVTVTGSATEITAFSAVLNGMVTANDVNTVVSFEYGTTDSYGASVTASQSPVNGNTGVEVSSEISGLIPNTLYHYRAVGENDGGVTYGTDQTFTTLIQAPVVTTIEASSIEATEATLNGIVNANDLSTTVTFEYGITDSYGSVITADQSPVSGTTDTDINAVITGLAPNTTYHFRLVGENSEASVNGGDLTFTTTKYDQLITFNAIPDKTTDDADFNPGAVSDMGLTISYTSSNELVATIVNNLIHIVGEGTTDITASQAGNDTVNIATPVEQTLTVTEATGIENPDFANLKVYPNPVKDILNIEGTNISISDNVVISIIDLNGKIIYRDNINDANYKINVSDFCSGLYFVEIKSTQGIQKFKLIKE